MADADEEELQKAFLMSLQQPAPEAKRSKPHDVPPSSSSSSMDVDADAAAVAARRMQRELRAAAAEQRMLASARKDPTSSSPQKAPASPHRVAASTLKTPAAAAATATTADPSRQRLVNISQALLPAVAEKLFTMVFGTSVSNGVLAQWCNQGFRFSPDQETSLGLVQHEGGPCGVLAPVQALVLKYLLFVHGAVSDNLPSKGPEEMNHDVLNPMLAFSEAQRTRALVSAMAEILWLAGGKKRSVVAVLDVSGFLAENGGKEAHEDEVLCKELDGVSLQSAAEVQKIVRICTLSSMAALLQQLHLLLPGFRSRMGALLFLFSALLSRGLDAVESDRDDPGQPLVSMPFGHASQEIVNLLICGQAVSNVFDGNMDLGGGMRLSGIPRNVEVGFLTLLEAHNLCKVGQFLKCPRWPIWVIGSESHYTVLFALHCNVQDENELEDRERRIRQAFDAHDQSGGGGFISAEALQRLVRDLNINMPRETLDNLCSNEIVVWNDLWQALHQIEKNRGGLKDPDAVSGKKHFEVYHFNGIAKTVTNSSSSATEVVHQRPRLAKLKVTVPPKWTPEEFMMDYTPAKGGDAGGSMDTKKSDAVPKEEPSQHAPLVDCIRTRWQRAVCNWTGDAPSIV